MLTTPKTIINAGDSSGSLSATQQLDYVFGYGMQATFTSTPAGTIKLQASIDNVNFSDIANSSFTISSAGTTVWNISDSNYRYVKVVWTASGGSAGALTVVYYGRGF